MIASVVVTLDDSSNNIQAIVDEVTRIPSVEIGEVGESSRRIPILIDAPDPNALEDTTRRLQECRGVVFVDVVLVHFEDEPGSVSAAYSGEKKLS